MKELSNEEIDKGLVKAYKEAGHNAYFGNGFMAGVKFAQAQQQSLPIDSVMHYDIRNVKEGGYIEIIKRINPEPTTLTFGEKYKVLSVEEDRVNIINDNNQRRWVNKSNKYKRWGISSCA